MNDAILAKQILKEMKRGADPGSLLPVLRELKDPYYEAKVLLQVSSNLALPWVEAKQGAERFLRLIPKVEEPNRRARLGSDCLDVANGWRSRGRNAQTHTVRTKLVKACIQALLGAVKPNVRTDLMLPHANVPEVFEAAVETKDIKVVKAAVKAQPERLGMLKDDLLRAHCGDYLSVWACDAETQRIVAWDPDTNPHAFAASAPEGAGRVTALTLAGARLDRDGDAMGRTYLQQAYDLLPTIQEHRRAKLWSKLRVAMEKAGMQVPESLPSSD